MRILPGKKFGLTKLPDKGKASFGLVSKFGLVPTGGRAGLEAYLYDLIVIGAIKEELSIEVFTKD